MYYNPILGNRYGKRRGTQTQSAAKFRSGKAGSADIYGFYAAAIGIGDYADPAPRHTGQADVQCLRKFGYAKPFLVGLIHRIFFSRTFHRL